MAIQETAQIAQTVLDTPTRRERTKASNVRWIIRRNPLGVIALTVVLVIILTAILADVIAPYSPTEIHQGYTLAPIGTETEDGRVFLLGTDEAGRDEFSRLVHGARVSLIAGVLSVLVGTLSGALIGLVSGYYQGALDSVVQKVMESLQAIPTLILALLFVAVVGRSFINVVIVIGLVQIPVTNRVVRSVVLSLKSETYIEASRVVGCSDARIILRHIAINVMAPVIVVATASLGGAITAEAFLAFLGMGAPPPTPSWGGMINDARPYMMTSPHLMIAPGVALSVTVLGWNLAGDTLRDILDPRANRS